MHHIAQHIAEPKRLRRIEVITGSGRRRRWSPAEKARIVAESFAPGAVVADVARRNELSAQHLTLWRRQAREGLLALPADAPAFTPVVVDQDRSGARVCKTYERSAPEALIEMEANGVVVRMREAAPAPAIEAVLHALRAPACAKPELRFGEGRPA